MKQSNQPLLVAIVGGSGSGKSLLADQLQAALRPHAGRLSLDDFYLDRSHLSPGRRARINFDRPAAIDWPAFERVLARCLCFKRTPTPGYDFRTHCRLTRPKALKPKPIMLVDGLWLLRSRRIRNLFGHRIFINAPMRLRLKRRLARDMAARGRSRKSVEDAFRKTVEPMHQQFVTNQMRWCDVVVGGDWSEQDVSDLAALLRQKAQHRRAPP